MIRDAAANTLPVKTTPSLFVTPEDVERNALKLLDLTGAKETGENKWRGICPLCCSETLSLRWTGKTLLYMCHSNVRDRAEHREELTEWIRDKGIRLDEFYAVPVVEQILAEFPFFRLDRKNNQQTHIIKYDGIRIELIPSELGHPTSYDEPLYLYAIRLAKAEFDCEGFLPTPTWVKFHVMDYLRWSGKKDTKITGLRNKMIAQSLKRMRGLQIVSTLEYQQGSLLEGEGLIAGWKFGRRHQMDPGMVAICLANWTISAIAKNKIIHTHLDFFSLPPLQRKIYQILHKHIGRQDKFVIGAEKLKLKTGFEREIKKFRYELKSSPNILDISVTLYPDDKIFVKRCNYNQS